MGHDVPQLNAKAMSEEIASYFARRDGRVNKRPRRNEHKRERIASLQSQGYHCAVCRSLEAFMGEVEAYLSPDKH